MEKNYWLVFAKRKYANHTESFRQIGLISWKQERNRFQIGDVVYVFVSDERCIKFKAIVTAKDVIREDAAFWDITAPMHKTYRLTLEAEYQDEGLDEKTLKEYGFKGGRSLQHPMKLKNHPDLLAYIRHKF